MLRFFYLACAGFFFLALPCAGQVGLLEATFAERYYKEGDFEKAASMLGVYGKLLVRQFPEGVPEDEEKLGLKQDFVDALERCVADAGDSVEEALAAARFLGLFYGSGKYGAPTLPGRGRLDDIGEALEASRPKASQVDASLDYYYEVYRSEGEGVRQLVGYSLVPPLVKEWHDDAWMQRHARKWLEKNEPDAFFEGCLRAALLGARVKGFLQVDPVKMEDVDWAAWDEVFVPLFAKGAGPAKVRLLGATSLVSWVPSLLNGEGTVRAIRATLDEEEVAGMWPYTQPFNALAQAGAKYVADEGGARAVAELLASQTSKLVRFEEEHGRVFLHKKFLAPHLLTLGYAPEVDPEVWGLVAGALEGQDAQGDWGIIMGLIGAGRFAEARGLLPEEGEPFAGHLSGVLTRSLWENYEAFLGGLDDPGMALELDAKLLRSFRVRRDLFPPGVTLTDLAMRVVEGRGALAGMPPMDQAEVVGGLGDFVCLEPYLSELVAAVDAVPLSEIGGEDSDRRWAYFHAVRMKALLLEEDWEGLGQGLEELGGLAQVDRTQVYNFWWEFKDVIAWPCMTRFLEGEGWDYPGMLDFFYRALASTCDCSSDLYNHRLPMYCFGRLAAMEAGVEYDLEKVKGWIETDKGRGVLDELLEEGKTRLFCLHPVYGMVKSVKEWEMAETREGFQADFYSRFFRKEPWCRQFVQLKVNLSSLVAHAGLLNPDLAGVYKAGELGPYGAFLLARYGAGFSGGEERREAFRFVIGELEGEGGDGPAVDISRLYLAQLEKRAGNDALALELLERVPEKLQRWNAWIVREVRGE